MTKPFVELRLSEKRDWSLRLGPGESVTVGSDCTCDVRLEGEGVSEHHVTLTAADDALWLCANAAVLLDERMVSGWERLTVDVVVQIGARRLILAFTGVKEQAPDALPEATPLPVVQAAPSAQALVHPDIFARPPAQKVSSGGRPQKPRVMRFRLALVALAMTTVAGGLALSTRPNAAPNLVSQGAANDLSENIRSAGPAVTNNSLDTAAIAQDTEQEIGEGAHALLSGDEDKAFAVYSRLATANKDFDAFARVLARRMRAKEAAQRPRAEGTTGPCVVEGKPCVR